MIRISKKIVTFWSALESRKTHYRNLSHYVSSIHELSPLSSERPLEYIADWQENEISFQKTSFNIIRDQVRRRDFSWTQITQDMMSSRSQIETQLKRHDLNKYFQIDDDILFCKLSCIVCTDS